MSIFIGIHYGFSTTKSFDTGVYSRYIKLCTKGLKYEKQTISR